MDVFEAESAYVDCKNRDILEISSLFCAFQSVSSGIRWRQRFKMSLEEAPLVKMDNSSSGKAEFSST
jgi:hypothetical protein